MRSQTSSGAFVVNDSVVQLLNCHLPFGGVGESGYGRYHGESGFLSFSNMKSICNTKAFNGYPLSTRFFPFDPAKQRAMTFLLKIGGTTYSQLAKGSAILAVIIAGAVGYIKMRPFLWLAHICSKVYLNFIWIMMLHVIWHDWSDWIACFGLITDH